MTLARSAFGLPLSSFKSLFRVVGVYAIANMLSALLPFVLLPVFTRFMDPADYGVMSMYQVLVAIFVPFVALSLHGAVGRRHVERASSNFPLYVTVCLKLALVSWVLTTLIAFALSGWIEGLTSYPRTWLWAPLLVAGSQGVLQIVLSIWQMENRPFSYAFLQCTMLVAQFGLSFYLVFAKGMSWRGGVIGQVSVAILFSFVALYFLWREKWITRGFDVSMARHALRFGLPLIPHVLGAWILTMVDRVFVVRYVGLSEAGIYSVGVQMGLAMSLLSTSFNQGWVPWLYARLKENVYDQKLQIVRFTYFYSGVMIFIAVIFSFASSTMIPLLVGEKYSEAARFVPWIALGYAFNGMYKMVTNYIFYVEKTHLLAWLTLVSGLINVACSYFLILNFGAIGGAYSVAISFLFSFLATWLLANRVYPMPWALGASK